MQGQRGTAAYCGTPSAGMLSRHRLEKEKEKPPLLFPPCFSHQPVDTLRKEEEDAAAAAAIDMEPFRPETLQY